MHIPTYHAYDAEEQFRSSEFNILPHTYVRTNTNYYTVLDATPHLSSFLFTASNLLIVSDSLSHKCTASTSVLLQR